MYKFCVVSKLTDSSGQGRSVIVVGVFAKRPEAFLSGHVNWYLSSPGSRASALNSSRSLSKSTASSGCPSLPMRSVTHCGNNAAIFATLPTIASGLCIFSLSIFVVLFSELNIKRVWFSIAFCTFTEAKATMYYCNNRKPLQCSFKFSILFIFHSYFNFFIRSQCSFNFNTFFNWGIKMESLLII